MEIRIRETGAVMYESEFRAAFPETSLPTQLTSEILDELGADVVLEGPQASPTRYQTAYRDGVEEVNGQWFTKYSVADISDEAKTAIDEAQAGNIRSQRDQKLSETDWRFRSDLTPSQGWKDYCQALRDIPTQTGFPWEVTWPTQPTE